MSRILIPSLVLAVLASPMLTPIRACMMLQKGYDGRISQNRHQAILIHQGDNQELILRVNYKIAGAKLPDQFAWIITTPSEPSQYRVAAANSFQEIAPWARRTLSPPRRNPPSRSLSSQADSPVVESQLIFGKPAKVGPYDIQPVRARGLGALQALNTWLTENGYPTEDPDHMRYFVENGFTFCCVRVAPAAGSASVAANGELAPLHLSFKSPKIYYPLLFSSRQGVFGVQLFVLSDQPLDFRASQQTLNRLNWRPDKLRRNVRVSAHTFPRALQDIFKKSRVHQPRTGWRLNLLDCQQVNQGNTIAKWKQDVFLSAGKRTLFGGIPAPPLWLAIALAAIASMGLLSGYFRRQVPRSAPRL
ncbi:MAG: DUF2330 domain-containing protein [Planctomycetaceae bacterium]